MASESDFDTRLRGALRADAGDGFDDAAGSGRTTVVSGVRRRHQRRLVMAGGVGAAVVAVALVASLGVGGSSTGPSPAREGLGPRPAPGGAPSVAPGAGADAPSATSSAGVAAGSAAAGSGGAASPNQVQGSPSAPVPGTKSAAPPSPCPVVTTSGGSQCAGTFATPSGTASAAAPYAVNGTQDAEGDLSFGAATLAPGTVRSVPGRVVRVVLPASPPFARWARPTVTSGTSVLAPTHQRVSSGGRGSQTVAFKAVRPGTAVVSAHAVCAPSAAGSQAYKAICHGGIARWHVTVEVMQ